MASFWFDFFVNNGTVYRLHVQLLIMLTKIILFLKSVVTRLERIDRDRRRRRLESLTTEDKLRIERFELAGHTMLSIELRQPSTIREALNEALNLELPEIRWHHGGVSFFADPNDEKNVSHAMRERGHCVPILVATKLVSELLRALKRTHSSLHGVVTRVANVVIHDSAPHHYQLIARDGAREHVIRTRYDGIYGVGTRIFVRDHQADAA